ncbi:MAG: alpha/beta hydrolase domain-containing protein [Burkholderiales bacterium]
MSEGRAPPASRTPSLGNRTLVRPEQVAFPAIPGVTVARRVNEIRWLRDWILPMPSTLQPYRPLVPQVDADGNETSGILLPDIAVPLGTYTGWNLYKAPFPEGELCDRFGTYVPFAATRAEREPKGDRRPSLEERYGDHAGYARRVGDAVRNLIAERLLLPEDGDLYVVRAWSEETTRRFATK